MALLEIIPKGCYINSLTLFSYLLYSVHHRGGHWLIHWFSDLVQSYTGFTIEFEQVIFTGSMSLNISEFSVFVFSPQFFLLFQIRDTAVELETRRWLSLLLRSSTTRHRSPTETAVHRSRWQQQQLYKWHCRAKPVEQGSCLHWTQLHTSKEFSSGKNATRTDPWKVVGWNFI